MSAYLEEKGFADISALKNQAIKRLCSYDDLPKTSQIYPQVNHELCTRCGKCIMCCTKSEHQALQLNDGYIEANKSRCVGCGLCHFVCPNGAITNS